MQDIMSLRHVAFNSMKIPCTLALPYAYIDCHNDSTLVYFFFLHAKSKHTFSVAVFWAVSCISMYSAVVEIPLRAPPPVHKLPDALNDYPLRALSLFDFS